MLRGGVLGVPRWVPVDHSLMLGEGIFVLIWRSWNYHGDIVSGDFPRLPC